MENETGAEIAMYKRILTSSVTLRALVAILLVFMCFTRMVLTYPGLDQPVAMDQAQIARELANGNGFSTKCTSPKILENATGKKHEKVLDLDHFKDTSYAPLNICAMAVGLKITGYNDFDAHRMEPDTKDEEGNSSGIYPSFIYGGDRVISGVSCFFFAIAVALTYLLGMRMFDELVGACAATFMIFSDLMLDYATSGLPQMLMLCCLLGCVHFIISALRHNAKHNFAKVLLYMSLAYLCVTLLCLTSWMGLWCAGGLIIFSAMYFRPFGAYAIPGFIIVCLGVLFSVAGNVTETGNVAGNAFYGLYDAFGRGGVTAESVLRSTGTDNQDLEGANFVLNVIGYACSQFSGIYANLGSIVVAPFFLLALINRYKNEAVEGTKWAIFTMWCFACVGMAFYGVDTPFNPSQMGIIFAPLFTIYGITLVFNFIARYKLNSGQFAAARGLSMFFMIFISAGPLISTMPGELWERFRSRIIINQSPYYIPPAFNTKLVDDTDEQSIILSDQPWAVAWYANRKSIWLPLKFSSYEKTLKPIIEKSRDRYAGELKPHMQGIVISEISRSPMQDNVSLARGRRTGKRSNGGYSEFASASGDAKDLLLWPYGASVDKNNKADVEWGNRMRNENLTHAMDSCSLFENKRPTIKSMWGPYIVFYDLGKEVELPAAK